MACHDYCRDADRVALEPADLIEPILDQIAIHAEANPNWLDISAAL